VNIELDGTNGPSNDVDDVFRTLDGLSALIMFTWATDTEPVKAIGSMKEFASRRGCEEGEMV
jgi:hypothetical protein